MNDLFSRVVCGVDGSDAGRGAVEQVRRLAPGDAQIVLVSVSETQLAVHAGMLAPKAAEEIESEARAALDEFAAEGFESRIVRGRADEMMLAAARDATLVAVGSHGTRRGPGALMGSVATRLVHDAPCSVLVTRAAAEPERFPRSIVVGVDGSSASLAAAAAAAEIGERLGVTVSVIAAGNADEIDEHALAAGGLAVERSDAKPVPALLQAAATVDLLVVASRGLRGIRALGSVSERVAHEAPCSVLVVRT